MVNSSLIFQAPSFLWCLTLSSHLIQQGTVACRCYNNVYQDFQRNFSYIILRKYMFRSKGVVEIQSVRQFHTRKNKMLRPGHPVYGVFIDTGIQVVYRLPPVPILLPAFFKALTTTYPAFGFISGSVLRRQSGFPLYTV